MAVTTCVKIPSSLSLSLGSLTKRLRNMAKCQLIDIIPVVLPRLAPCPLSLSLSLLVPTFLKVTPRPSPARERDSYWEWLESSHQLCPGCHGGHISYAQWSTEKYKLVPYLCSDLCSSFSIHNNHWLVSFGPGEQQQSWHRLVSRLLTDRQEN